jgi:hypothetical protein
LGDIMGSQSDEEYLEEFDFVRQKLEGVFPRLFFYENSDDENVPGLAPEETLDHHFHSCSQRLMSFSIVSSKE